MKKNLIAFSMAALATPAFAGSGRLVGLDSGGPAVLYEINPVSGAATAIVTLDLDSSLVGLSELNGVLYGSDLSDPYTVRSIDEATGVTTLVSDQDGSSNWTGLATSNADGLLWTVDEDDSRTLKSLDPITGIVTPVGVGGGPLGRGMAYDDTHGVLYGVGDGENLWTWDTSTGVATLVGSTGLSDTGDVGLAYDELNEILYLNDGNGGALYTLSTTTGQATLVGANGMSNIDGLAWFDGCPYDINSNGRVNILDAISVIRQGIDLNNDGEGNIKDAIVLLKHRGRCPT